MAGVFRADPDGHIEGNVQKLLEDPIVYAEALLRTLGPGELNAKGRVLCGQFRSVMANTRSIPMLRLKRRSTRSTACSANPTAPCGTSTTRTFNSCS